MEMHIYYFSQRTMAAMLKERVSVCFAPGRRGAFRPWAIWGRALPRCLAGWAPGGLGLERHPPGPDDGADQFGAICSRCTREKNKVQLCYKPPLPESYLTRAVATVPSCHLLYCLPTCDTLVTWPPYTGGCLLTRRRDWRILNRTARAFSDVELFGTRFTAPVRRLGRPVDWAFDATCLGRMTAPINLEDLFSVYARKV